MGAYLSEPMTAKETEEGDGNRLKYGACSMQGWRVSQEDAHNCIASFDEASSLFAVYDGHGGSEVAVYLSRHLPEFLKTCTAYKNGEFVKGLEECYLKIDESIKTPEVLKEIQQIAKSANSNDAAVDYEEENVGALYEEATMPLDKLVAKYQSVLKSKLAGLEDIEEEDCKPGSSKSGGSAGSSSRSRGSGGSSSSKEQKVNGESSAMNVDSDDKAVSSSSSSTPGEQTKTESNKESCDSPSSTSIGELIVEGKSIKIEPAKNSKQEDAVALVESSSSETPQSTTAVNGNGSASEDDVKAKKVVEEKTSDSEAAASKVTVNGDSSTPVADAELGSSSDGKSEKKEEKASDAENANKQTANGESSTSGPVSADSSTNENATPTSSETPRRKKVQPVLVKIEDSKPERRSPRKSQQKSFDCSDSDESDDADDAGYNVGDSDSEDLDDEEEDLEEESSNDDDDDDDDEDDYDDEDAEEDERFLSDIQEPGYDSGSTAVVCLMKWEADGLSLWVANAGDSRCVVCREGKAIDMSHDHKPELDEEAQRIVKAGGKVTQEGRVNGGLNLSRAIGDHSYKQNATLPLEEQMISPLPSIEHIVLNPTKDKFIVLACDGVWNSMTSQEVVDFVGKRLEEEKPLPKICEELFDACLAPDTCGDGTGCDNMTAIIVQLSDAPQVFSGSKRRCSDETTPDSESTKKSRVD